jgi:hypothetical protein
MKRSLRALPSAGALIALAACAPQSPEVESGQYRYYAAAGSLAGAVPRGLEMEVEPGSANIRLRSGETGEIAAQLAASEERWPVCPAGREARVMLTTPQRLVLGRLVFDQAALAAGCTEGLPRRIQLIDLEVRNPASAVPYPHWIEMCRVGDFGCPDQAEADAS